MNSWILRALFNNKPPQGTTPEVIETYGRGVLGPRRPDAGYRNCVCMTLLVFQMVMAAEEERATLTDWFSSFFFSLFSYKGRRFREKNLTPTDWFSLSFFPFISLPSLLFKGEFHLLPFLLPFYSFFHSHKIHMHEKILTTHELKGKEKNQICWSTSPQ